MPGKEKAPKKSKVELELEKQLELEEAARAEEADLKRQEDEERRRREAEAARRLAVAEKRKDELERLESQRAEDQEAEIVRLAALDNLAREEAAAKEWSRFVECSVLPDCMKEPDLNAHITLWGMDEDALAEDERRLERQRMKDRRHRAPPAVPNPAPVESEGRHQPASSASSPADGDEASERARLKRVLDGCANTERLVLNLQARIADAAEDRDLAQVDWCLQYVRRFRDLIALKIDSATARVLQCGDELERVLEDTAAMAQQQAAQAKAPARGPAGAPKAQAAGAAAAHSQQPEELKKEVLECLRMGDIDYGLWAHTNQRFFRRKAVAFKEIGVSVDLPKSAAMLKMPLALRVIRTLYDQVSSLNPSSHYVSVGGVVQLQQLNLPPPAKPLKGGWLMRELTPLATSVSVAAYSSSGTVAAGNSAQLQPFRLSYRVPEFVYLPGGAPKIGWWNARTGSWDEEGITDVKFSPEDRTLQLSTTNLEPLAIIQPRALDFPYRSWSYAPTGPESGLFRIAGSRFEARMEIRAGRVRLQRPSAPALVQATQLTSPGALLKALARSGINLMPTDEDAEFCRKPLKTKAVEARVHVALAQVAHAFEIRSSTLNSSRGPAKCVFEVRLCDPVYEQAEPEDPTGWVTVLCDEERFVCIEPADGQSPQTPLAAVDSAETELAGELSHSSLRRALIAYYTNRKANPRDAPKSTAPPRAKRTAAEELEAVQAALRADDPQVLRWHLAARRMFNLIRPFVFH